MDETERRHATRYEATVPVSLSITAPIEIEGKMVNYSRAGALIVAAGHVDEISSIKTKGCRGRLVRAFPEDRHTTAHAIAFEEVLEDSVGTQTRERDSVATHATPPGRT